MIQVGITGGIGSGKTLICKIIESFGYPVYNADEEAKRCYVSNEALKLAVIDLIGSDSYLPNGELNKSFVAEKVFKDNVLLQQLNSLVHPVVAKSYSDWLEKHKNQKMVFKEAAILFETGGHKSLHATVLVCAPQHIRVQRVMQRDNTTETDILQRINKQWSDEEKEKLADYILVNDGLTPILDQILTIQEKLLQIT